VQAQNELIQSGFGFYVACGILCAVLFGLIIWQPKAGPWIANAVEAESSHTPGEPEFIGTAAALNRKPIGSTAWTQVFPPKNYEGKQP
jgi:hypothetical protein